MTDVDNDGSFEIFVAGFDGPNMVLKYNEEWDILENMAIPGTPYKELMDVTGQAIGKLLFILKNKHMCLLSKSTK